ncbi:MAG TPA: non-ribosomal peptide synthetase, partial [Bacteroidetes bacterium]|nr:non-ribosomal peptide synthetase [Bacteroidota bacterium]
QLYVLDGHLQPVPVGVPGELLIGGDPLALGYHRREDVTRRAFIDNPLPGHTGEKLYRTGDIVKWLPNGELQYIGRLDTQVKIRGNRVELGEVETVLNQHPAIHRAVVVVREDRSGGKRLVAYIVPEHPDSFVLEEVRRSLADRLTEAMRPTAYKVMDELPLTPNEKVDRDALPEPETGRPDLESEFIPPRDPLELKLMLIWEDLLSVRPIGIKDNFFDLGGHSLLAVRLFAEIEAVSGKELSLATLFHAPTIEQLAEILRREGWSPPLEKVVPANAEGALIPLFLVPPAGAVGLSFIELSRHLGDDQPVYVLLPSGLDDEDNPTGHMSEIAKVCIEEIRRLRPKGPYILGGLCFGGYVAFEIAQQLSAEGVQVPLVVLFDVHGPRFARSENLLVFHFRKFASLQGREKLHYLAERWRGLKRRAQQFGFKTAYRFFHSLGMALPSSLRRTRDAHLMARLTYSARPYPGRGLLFHAERQPEGFDTPLKGWGGLFQGGLLAHEAPGDHSTMMHEPHVRIVGQQLMDVLRPLNRELADDNGRGGDSSRITDMDVV